MNIFSITEISLLLKKHIEDEFFDICIRGEISSFKKHSSGHCYFTLKDEASVIDAVCWRGTKLDSSIEDGIEVLAYGKITTYKSKYQIIVNKIELSGEGSILKLLMLRKEKFKLEGLFDKKLPIPKFPKIIGVITSQTGAVLQDIIHRVSARYPCCMIKVWPVTVQGESAKVEIAEAIFGFNKMEDRPDVLIVARGGGSLEDLMPFNEEEVVRAAFKSDIPIISAVGHETDVTLIDFASSIRAPTPTAAAEIATPSITDLINSVNVSYQRCLTTLSKTISHHSALIKRLYIKNPILENLLFKFDDICDRLDSSIFFKKLKEKLQNLNLKKPSTDILSIKLEQLVYKINISIKIIFSSKSSKLDSLNLFSPKEVLKKGFCFVKSSSKDKSRLSITSSKMIERGDELLLTFHDGEVKTVAV